MEELKGKVWRRVIERSDLQLMEKQYDVISTKLLSGDTLIHELSDTKPGPNFDPVEPDLKDVYFSAMSKQRGKKTVQSK